METDAAKRMIQHRYVDDKFKSDYPRVPGKIDGNTAGGDCSDSLGLGVRQLQFGRSWADLVATFLLSAGHFTRSHGAEFVIDETGGTGFQRLRSEH